MFLGKYTVFTIQCNCASLVIIVDAQYWLRLELLYFSIVRDELAFFWVFIACREMVALYTWPAYWITCSMIVCDFTISQQTLALRDTPVNLRKKYQLRKLSWRRQKIGLCLSYSCKFLTVSNYIKWKKEVLRKAFNSCFPSNLRWNGNQQWHMQYTELWCSFFFSLWWFFWVQQRPLVWKLEN